VGGPPQRTAGAGASQKLRRLFIQLTERSARTATAVLRQDGS